MAVIRESIIVNAPISTVYNQWTQFEEFPLFMEGVEEVRQLDDTRLQWVVEVGGKRHEWTAKITEQKPDSRIVWRAEAGKDTGGNVTLHSERPAQTKVELEVEYEAESL